MAYDEETAERIRKLLSPRSDVVEKKMMGGLCFMVDDRMCCAVSGRGGLLVRVGADGYTSALAEPHVRAADMAGRTMSGFVRVDPAGYRTDAALSAWVQRGLEFAAMLATKPAVRKTARATTRRRK
jgi:TfoX/Sxy family transcriptional regulator of competence genes